MKLLSLIFAFAINSFATAQDVGIGTANPSATLEVKKPLKSTVKISSNNFSDTTELNLSNRNPSNQGTDYIIKSVREEGLFFSTDSDLAGFNNDSIMVITPNGNVGIGGRSTTASAILEIKSTNKGVVMPKMTSAQRTAIINPVEGLTVFDINTQSYWYYTSTGWKLQGGLSAICYGNVSSTGFLQSGSGNFTVLRISTGLYQITITGHSYQFQTYSTVATASHSTLDVPRIVMLGSGGGDLHVYIYNTAGARVDNQFQFVVYD